MAPNETATNGDARPESGGDEHRVDLVEDDPFVELLTPESKVRILLALMRVRGEKLNPTAICDRADIGVNAWYDNKGDLIDLGVVKEAGHAGNSPLYRVEMDDPVVERLSDVRKLVAERRNRARGTALPTETDE